ncbi:MAG: type I restriction endonuclease subunit R, partial [Akkermansiaceae bacterium]
TNQTYNSRALFGDYIHKYYYNRSIKDGYTLRLIREEIQTEYKLRLKEALEQIKVLKDGKNRKFVYSHEKFVEPMLQYIVEDFEAARVMKNDNSIGAMVICDSAEQVEQMAEIFAWKYARKENIHEVKEERLNYAADHENIYNFPKDTVKTCALILHNAGTKEERKAQVEAFKEGKIDILFVFNMLLTGFDAA